MTAISSPLSSGNDLSLGAVNHVNPVSQQPDGNFLFSSDLNNLAAYCADNLVFRAKIVNGDVPGLQIIHKFGSANIGTTMQPITSSGFYRTPTTPIALEVVSNNANDTSAGTGARSIHFFSAKADWQIEEEIVDLNGLTPVAIPVDSLRLCRFHVEDSGTYANETSGSHVGNITVQESGGGAVWCTIASSPFPFGQSQIGVCFVPAGKIGYILSKKISVTTTKVADIYLFQRPNADVVTAPYSAMRLVERDLGVVGSIQHVFQAPLGPFVGPCDVGFMGRVTLTTGDVSVEFELLLIDV